MISVYFSSECNKYIIKIQGKTVELNNNEMDDLIKKIEDIRKQTPELKF